MALRELVGGSSGEPKLDVVRRVRGGWKVFSEKTGRPLSRAYSSKSQAAKRLGQIEYFKARDGGDLYVPPPGPGTAAPNHPSSLRRARPAAPDPNTPPRPMVVRSDARARLPRQIPPTRISQDYARALLRLVERVKSAWAPVARAVPELAKQAAEARGDRMDAGESTKLRALVAQAVAQARASIKQDEIESLARKFAQQTSTYQRMQLSRQVKAALGADPVFRDKGLAARADQFTHENVALVRSIPERLHGELEAIVTRAVSSARPGGGRGSSPDTLRQDIEDRFEVSRSRAKVIARDQIGKFYAGVNHARQKEMGVERFTWMTAGDERVREEHADLDGEEFSYDDPPVVDGEVALPGEPVQCRCWAEPIFEDDDEPDESDDEPDDADDDE